MDIIVVGAGSLGSLLGGLLARDHQVTLVGREPHVGAVAESGLSIVGEIDAHVTPAAATTVPERADLALVTVKAYDTTGAAAALTDCKCETVLSVQNGLGNEATLAERLDETVLAGTATYGASLEEPGRVRCTGVAEVAVGSRTGERSRRAEEIGEAFRTAGIETTVADDMPWRLWEKLAVNAGINATTALARVQNGALADGPIHDVARRAAREAASVARERGIDLADDEAIDALERVVQATASNESSMCRDVQRERRTEVEAINGVVADSDVTTPVNETLAALLRAWERERS